VHRRYLEIDLLLNPEKAARSPQHPQLDSGDEVQELLAESGQEVASLHVKAWRGCCFGVGIIAALLRLEGGGVLLWFREETRHMGSCFHSSKGAEREGEES